MALLLAQSGEFALVYGMGLLDELLSQHLLIVVMLSMFATLALERLANRIFLVSGRSITTIPDVDIGEAEQDTRPVILAGFGRMGHRIGYIMELMKVPYVAIDRDASLVDRERAEGKSVYFGDAQRPEVLRAARATDAPFVTVSIDGLEATEQVVSSLHSAFPDTPIFARGHDLGKCRDLRTLGAHFIVS